MNKSQKAELIINVVVGTLVMIGGGILGGTAAGAAFLKLNNKTDDLLEEMFEHIMRRK